MWCRDDFDVEEVHNDPKQSQTEISHEEVLETFGESVHSFDEVGEEEVGGGTQEESASIEYEDDDKGRKGRVMAFNFAGVLRCICY